MNTVAIATQALLIGGIFVAAYAWWKSQPPEPEKEKQRGYDDAKHFHTASGVNAWSMKGFVDYQKARGTAGPYEAGMVKYINEVLKLEPR